MRAPGYFPGYNLPDFSPTTKSKNGIPGHISIVSSPFLANSKSPSVPHILESKSSSNNSAKKKQVVINIINGSQNNISSFEDIEQKIVRNNGLQNIMTGIKDPLNNLQRGKRSIDMKNGSQLKHNTTAKVNGTQRSNLDYYYDDYLYFSPPDGQLFNDYGVEEPTGVVNPEPIDPSQLLIGIGGSQSTTRIPFRKKHTNVHHIGIPSSKAQPSVTSPDKTGQLFEKQKIVSSSSSPSQNLDTNKKIDEIPFGDFSNLVQLSQTVKQTPAPDQRNPALSDVRQKPSTGVADINQNQESFVRPTTFRPAFVNRLKEQIQREKIRQEQLNKITVQDFSDYKQYDYNDYFDFSSPSAPSKPARPNNPPQTQNQNPYAPSYPYPQYPPQYPFYPYPINPASASTSTSCSSSGCAAAASAGSGSSSSSSTSTSSAGGGGASSAAASSSFGGSSTSTSGRSGLASILAEYDFDEWNSFDPMTEEEIEEHKKNGAEANVLLPAPGIVQPLVERKKRSPQNRESIMSRLTDFANDDLDDLEEDLESSQNPMVMHVNQRVDYIMDKMDTAMHHSG